MEAHFLNMARNQPSFCSPVLPLHSGRRTRHRIALCSGNISSSERYQISRRAILAGLASFLVAPVVSAAPDDPDDAKPLTGFVSRSGLKYFDFVRGEGPTPKWGDFVNIHYTAYTISSDEQSLVKQDSSYDYGDAGYLLHHGNGEHIIGLEEAIHSMSVGGRRRCIIPREIAYFKQDLGPVPLQDRRRRAFSQALSDGDGTVVFDIELRRIIIDPNDRGYYNDITPTDEEIIQTFAEQQGQFADE